MPIDHAHLNMALDSVTSSPVWDAEVEPEELDEARAKWFREEVGLDHEKAALWIHEFVMGPLTEGKIATVDAAVASVPEVKDEDRDLILIESSILEGMTLGIMAMRAQMKLDGLSPEDIINTDEKEK